MKNCVIEYRGMLKKHMCGLNVGVILYFDAKYDVISFVRKYMEDY